MERDWIRRLPDGGAIVSQGLKPLTTATPPRRSGRTRAGKALTLLIKAGLAVCTLGLYPIIPWVHGRITATVHELHIRSAADRYATRQAGRQRYHERLNGQRRR